MGKPYNPIAALGSFGKDFLSNENKIINNAMDNLGIQKNSLIKTLQKNNFNNINQFNMHYNTHNKDNVLNDDIMNDKKNFINSFRYAGANKKNKYNSFISNDLDD